MKYRSEIDGMRAIAVVPVVLFHAGFETFSGGFVGVDVFFVISGYLITALILADIEKDQFSLFDFYERRARRILPALVVVCAVSSIFAVALMLPHQLIQFGQTLIGVFTFVANVILWRQSGYFSLAAEEKPLLHTWSLSVEEQYYILFPIFLVIVARFGSRPMVALTLLGGFVSLMLAEWGWRYEPTANFFLLPTRAWELLLGSLCAMIAFKPERVPMPVREVAGLTGLAMILFAIFSFDSQTPFPSLYALLPTVGTALIILFVTADNLVGRLLSLKLFVFIGLVSYSAYLWHQPLFAFLRIHFNGEVAPSVLLSAGFLTFGLAALTWWFVEQPMRNRRTGPIRRRSVVFASSGAVVTAFVALGATVIANNGLPGRLPEVYTARMASLDALKKGRTEGIAVGRCHFNSNAEGANPSSFIANWSCQPQDAAIAIFGDSHAADKAHALRAAGIEVLQMTGNGCSMNPTIGGRPRCQRLLDAFLVRAAAADVSTVLVTGRLDAAQLRPDYLAATFQFWADRFDQVIFLAPMPSFSRLETIFIKTGIEGVAAIVPDMTDNSRFFALVEELVIPANVTILDSRDFVCRQEDCVAALNGQMLLVDEGHLSASGAQHFGTELAARLGQAVRPAHEQAGAALER